YYPIMLYSCFFTGSCGKCPADWFFHNSSCYFFSIVKSASFQKNWHDSRADCISRGSDLTVIDSPEEQKYLSAKGKSLLNGRPSTWENGFWVGLTDLEKEKKWVWINNVTEVESRYWSPGEPNNHGPDGEDCAVIVYKSTSPWKTRYDAKCQDHKLYWLCETHVQ
uniref:CD209 antigen-like protein E n=1 Tax=Gouania willdenowi TaxID=441366 RepID=A0A8C5E9L8_GOUWI